MSKESAADILALKSGERIDVPVQVIRFQPDMDLKKLVVPDAEFDIQSTSLHDHYKLQLGRATYNVWDRSGDIVIPIPPEIQPVVLFELNASFCYLLLTINGEGRAILMHNQMLNFEEKIRKYRQRLLNLSTPGSGLVTFIGGINDAGAPSRITRIYESLQDVSKLIRPQLQDKEIVYQSSLESTELSDPPLKGFVYLPGMIAMSQMDTLILIGDGDEDNVKQQLFSQWR